jgi:hypothetical protein
VLAPLATPSQVKKEKKNKGSAHRKQNSTLSATGPETLHTATATILLPSRNREVTVEELAAIGPHLGEHLRLSPQEAERLKGTGFPPVASTTLRRYLMAALLKIRNKRRCSCKLSLNRCQQQVEHDAGPRNIILKARQVGITTYVAARFFLSTIFQPGTLSVQVAHDQQSAEEIFRIVHRFLENLPEAWRKGALHTSRANVRQIVFPRMDSEYRVETAADPNAGRGLTVQNLHCSEVARWPGDVDETLASLRAAVPPDGEIFLESTPDGASGAFYEEWLSAHDPLPPTSAAGALLGVEHPVPVEDLGCGSPTTDNRQLTTSSYIRHFFPWWWEPSYRRDHIAIVNFTAAERELMQKHGLDAGQIAFRREVRINFRNLAAAEYAEEAETCFLTSGHCIFDLEVLGRKLKLSSPHVADGENGALLYFLPPVAGKQYIIGVDPAGGGLEGDNACAQVIDQETGMQCAELLGHFNPYELAARLLALGRRYKLATLAVERNSLGHEVLAYLRMENNYPNVYIAIDDKPGWLTNAATRPAMLMNLELMLANMPDLFLSKRLLQECRTFVRHKDGKCAAAAGAHDDTVMAMAIAQAVRAECRGKSSPPMEAEPTPAQPCPQCQRARARAAAAGLQLATDN